MSKQWSAEVTLGSHALDLEKGIFTWHDPSRIALYLRAAVKKSDNNESDPYRSAMSMLTLYINRNGGNLPESQRQILEAAKRELRQLFRKTA